MENMYMFCIINSIDLILVKLLFACKAYALVELLQSMRVACI